jgi:hypothetical protein
MNVIVRSFATEADRIAKAERARRKPHKLAITALLACGIAAIGYYVWAATLCGTCGVPLPLPPA